MEKSKKATCFFQQVNMLGIGFLDLGDMTYIDFRKKQYSRIMKQYVQVSARERKDVNDSSIIDN